MAIFPPAPQKKKIGLISKLNIHLNLAYKFTSRIRYLVFHLAEPTEENTYSHNRKCK